MPATPRHLTLLSPPKLQDATLVLALSGWMDGGAVSTGTVRQLMSELETVEVARIDSDPFYIYNFPGSMEVAALFRPSVRYRNGRVDELEMPGNTFYAAPADNLVFFVGKEPNLLWQAFADCIFKVCREVGVKRIIFVGSFGGSVPHTREPRLYGSISHERLRKVLEDQHITPSEYDGPASFATLILTQAPRRGVEMLSLAAEIPGYLEGENPVSIEAVTRRVARILGRGVNLDRLRRASDEWEAKVTQAVEKDKKLAATIRELEEQYDNQLIGSPGTGAAGAEEQKG
jgi:proteasome assembly chaperone (PAC2) family protein